MTETETEQQPDLEGPFVIRCVGLAGLTHPGQRAAPPKGEFLKSYDPEAHQGQGYALWTSDLAEALEFPDAYQALQCWTQVPTSRPTRADGQPNKPLTAFSVEVLSREMAATEPLDL